MRVKKLTKLADDKQLKQEEGIGDTDTWNGYHGRQKQVRLRRKLYFKIHEEIFDQRNERTLQMRDRCSECHKPIAEEYAKYRTVDKNNVFCNGFCKYAWDTRKAVRKRLEEEEKS